MNGLAGERAGRAGRGGENVVAMTTTGAVESRQKIALVWAERREQIVAVRVQYDVAMEGGCKVYNLTRMEEIGAWGA